MFDIIFLVFALGFAVITVWALFRKDVKTISKILYVIMSVAFLLSAFSRYDKLTNDPRKKIPETMVKFERGIKQNSKTVLDSICAEGISQRILDEVYNKRGISQPEIVSATTRIIIYGEERRDSFQGILLMKDAEDDTIPTLRVTLYLESGKWKVKDFEIEEEIAKTESK